MRNQLRSFVFALTGLAGVWAFPFYGNQSALVWKSAETEHFRFHYPLEFQGQAAEIVSFAEAVHDSVESRYRVKLPGRVNMVIRNALFSNGLASPINNTMNVWLTDWDFKVRSTHRWMNDVVTHEFSHLVSIQSGAKFAPYIHGLQLSWQDYDNEPVQVNASVTLPFGIYPIWFAEGTAQYESARMGFDAWDTHRDMLLRTAMLSDSVLPLAQMRDFPDNGLGSEQGPYNQGFNLVKYISERFGDKAIPNLWSEMARLHRVTFTAACSEVLGISEEQLYKDWKVARVEQYTLERSALGALRTGTKRSREAFWQDFPQMSSGALWGVSNMGSTWFEGSLFRLPLPNDTLKSFDSLPKEKRPDSLGTFALATFAENPFHLNKPWLDKGFSVRAVPGQSPLVAYVTYEHRDRSGRAYFDIAVDDTSASPWLGKRKSIRWVTKFADAVYPDLSPDGSTVIFVRRERNSARFVLAKAPVLAPGVSPDDPVDLFRGPDQLTSFGVYTPRWSPDGKRVTFSYYDGQSRKIAIIDADGHNLQVLVAGAYDARDPVWSPDGKSLVYSSDQSGIFNLYRLAVAPSIALQVIAPVAGPVALTNVLGGAFTPAVDSSGIWYIGYDKDGFSLYQLGHNDSLPHVVQGERLGAKGKPLSIGAIELQGIERPYRPLPTQPVVVPLLSVEDKADDLGSVRNGIPVAKVGVALGLMDPLQKNYLQLALLLEMGKGVDYVKATGLNPALQSDLLAMGENHSFPVSFGLGYMRRNTPTQDTVRYEDPRSKGDSLAVSHMAMASQVLQGSAGYSVLKKGDSLVVGAGAQWATFNLYEDGFAWDYFKSRFLSAALVWSSTAQEQGDAIGGEGNGVTLSWQGAQSSLFRPGTFKESFTINPNGVVIPAYRDYLVNEAWLSAWYGVNNPLHAGARLVGGMLSSGILAWSGQSSHTDTLDHFYHHSLHLFGYPAMVDKETWTLHGDRTLEAQLHYLFPLYQDLNATWWIFTHKSFYADVFALAGSAWFDGSSMLEHATQVSSWKRSAGLELRFANRIFLTQTFDVSMAVARGFDRVQTKTGSAALETVNVPFLPTAAEPTAVSLTIGFQFNAPWSGSALQHVSGPSLSALR